MGSIAARKTHYMTFPHSLTGRVRANFTFVLTKNGDRLTDVEVNIHESPNYIYTASFVNDGDDFAIWTLTISDVNVLNVYYVETWEVRKLVIEENVKQIRSRMDSDGGSFINSTDN